MTAYEELLEKTASTGAKIDIVLSIIRLQMFFDDKHGVQKNIERAQKYYPRNVAGRFYVLTTHEGS